MYVRMLNSVYVCLDACYSDFGRVRAIWTHRMIRRSVPVRAVKTRRRFRFKIASFHVSVCSCIISSFIVISSIYICYLLYFMWPSSLFTSMITCIPSWDIKEYSLYLCTWSERLSASFHVIVIHRVYIRPSSIISWTVTLFDPLVSWPSSYLSLIHIWRCRRRG